MCPYARPNPVEGSTAGDSMVFVKVREVYDLHTVQNKMTVIGIHTPKPDIIKANFPGLLMQCKAYRPYSCDVRVACASTLPLDPAGVGLTEGEVAPEDLFNPILYKAMSNVGMSQLEARIFALATQKLPLTQPVDVDGPSAMVDVDNTTDFTDEFPVYYGLLANAHGWRTADPQAGLAMKDLKPLVYEVLQNIPDNGPMSETNTIQLPGVPGSDGGLMARPYAQGIRGSAKPLPFINCTSYNGTNIVSPGFQVGADPNFIRNAETDVPWVNCVVAAILVPPSRLHELYYRMVVEWTIEFTAVRPIGEITNWNGLGAIGNISHYQNYSFENTKQALGVESEVMDHDQTMVSANVDITKVM